MLLYVFVQKTKHLWRAQGRGWKESGRVGVFAEEVRGPLGDLFVVRGQLAQRVPGPDGDVGGQQAIAVAVEQGGQVVGVELGVELHRARREGVLQHSVQAVGGPADHARLRRQ